MATYNLLYKNLEEFKIKGLGKAGIEKFKKLGVETLYDLLYFFLVLMKIEVIVKIYAKYCQMNLLY